MSDSYLTPARESGFSECVISLRRALTTTPVGWLLALWFCWERVPASALSAWLGPAGAIWIGSLLSLQHMIGSGARLAVHGPRLQLIAGLDGFAWGLLTWFLIGRDPVLDAILMALLCGVTSINAQVYGTYVTAYYWQMGILWTVSMLGLMQSVGSQGARDYIAGLSVFFALSAYYTRETSKRLLEGMRLHHANAALAEQLGSTLRMVEIDASTDALTGHWNRRALDEAVREHDGRHTASGKPYSILMLDIDFFKKINDEFGHMIGDDVLRAIAKRLSSLSRPDDLCARFGGEEFVIVLPDTSLAMAMEIGERIRQGLAQSPVLNDPEIWVTASIGVASKLADQSIAALFAAADAAVYVAKRAGRNQVRSQPVSAEGSQ